MRRERRMDLTLRVLALLLAGELGWLSWLAAGTGSEERVMETQAAVAPAPAAAESSPSEPPEPSETSDEDIQPVDTSRAESVIERPSIPEPPHEPACTIEVVGPDGEPRESCTIVAIKGDAFAWCGSTNDKGIMFDARPASAPVDLLIDACTCLHRERGVVLEDHGHVRIRIPEGLTIQGRVTFDGGAAVPCGQLRVDLMRPGPLPGVNDGDVRTRWSFTHDRFAAELHAPVEPDGTFRIAGLQPGFAGRIALRPVERLSLVDPARPGDQLLTVAVSADTRDIVLHARRFPVLSGVMGRAPGGWAEVTLVATLPDSTRVSRWTGCHPGSRFDIPLDFRTPSSVCLTIMDRDRRLARTVDLPGPFDGDIDVGTLDPPSIGGEPVPRDPEPVRREAEEDAEHQRTLLALEREDAKMRERFVHATVVDEAGAPIEGADIRAPSARRSGRTDEHGVFELGDWLPDVVDLDITARAYQQVTIKDLDVSALDGRTIVMKRGHAVRLTVVDSRGAPFVRPGHLGRCDHGWEVWATAPGSDRHYWPDDGMPWGTRRSIGGHPWSPAGPGVYDFLELPDGPVVFHVEGVEGPVWTLEHDSSVAEAKIVVPAHGGIRLDLDLRLDARAIQVDLEPLDTGGTALAFRGDGALTYDGSFLLRAVLPCDYVVRAQIPTEPKARTWRAFGAEHRITVRAGETTVVALGR